MVAEGIRTVKSAYELKNKLNIQASVIEETYRVLYEDKSPQKALEDLMKVEIDTEFSGVRGLKESINSGKLKRSQSLMKGSWSRACSSASASASR